MEAWHYFSRTHTTQRRTEPEHDGNQHHTHAPRYDLPCLALLCPCLALALQQQADTAAATVHRLAYFTCNVLAWLAILCASHAS